MCHNINNIPLNLEQYAEELTFFGLNFDEIVFCESIPTNDIEHLYNHPNYNLFTNNTSRNRGRVCSSTQIMKFEHEA